MRMKTTFGYKSFTVPALIPAKTDFEGEFLFLYSVVGTVEASLDGSSGWFPVYSSLKFTMKKGERFNSICFRSTAGGTVNYFFGVGDISNESGGGSGGDGAEIIVGAVDDPNGVHTPDEPLSPAIYYKDDAAIQFWIWGVTAQAWFPVVS